jgi:hypothetical protein
LKAGLADQHMGLGRVKRDALLAGLRQRRHFGTAGSGGSSCRLLPAGAPAAGHQLPACARVDRAHDH